MSEEEKPKTARKPSLKIHMNDDDKNYLSKVGVNLDWLKALAKEYGFDEFQYLHKFRAFRCYKAGVHVDWIDINDLSLLNGGQQLVQILLKHQPVSKSREVIKLRWR